MPSLAPSSQAPSSQAPSSHLSLHSAPEPPCSLLGLPPPSSKGHGCQGVKQAGYRNVPTKLGDF